MLASDNRLKTTKELKEVKEKGKLFQSDDFAMILLKRGDKELTKFGFIVSTKVSGMSTHRNRVKRALSEAARQNLSSIGKGYSMVFLAKKSIVRKSTEEIMKQVESVFKRSLLKK